MLLSCSLIIRINGSHDTALLLSLIQPLLGSHLTFNHVSPLCTKEEKLVWRLKYLDSFLSRLANTFEVSQTCQCLMFLQGFLTPIQKVYWTKLFHTFLLKSAKVQDLDAGWHAVIVVNFVHVGHNFLASQYLMRWQHWAAFSEGQIRKHRLNEPNINSLKRTDVKKKTRGINCWLRLH